jgi:hypothetical protein
MGDGSSGVNEESNCTTSASRDVNLVCAAMTMDLVMFEEVKSEAVKEETRMK